MDLIEGLRTTGAVRAFRDEEVPDATIRRLLDTARFAPNGGNAQSWHVIVLRSPAARAAVRDLYVDGWRRYVAATAAGLRPWAPITDRAREAAAMEAGVDGPLGDFAEHFDRVPVLLVVCADLRKLAAVDRDLDRYSMVGGASVYPFVWSVLLAARAEGLGGVITTMPIAREPELKALLSVPDTHAVAAVVALGVPEHQPTKLRREGVESFATMDAFDGEVLDG
jgi:nitroreductase